MSSMYAMPAASWEAFVLDGELGDSSFLQCLLEDADDVLVGCNTQVPAPAEQTCNTVKSKPRKRGYLAADERMSRVREQNRCEAVTCCLSLLYDVPKWCEPKYKCSARPGGTKESTCTLQAGSSEIQA